MVHLVATSGSLALAAYVLLGVFYFDVHSIPEFLQWTLRSGTVGTLSMWGQWSLERLPMALGGMLSSFVPTPLMVSPSELLYHRVQLGRIAIDIAVLAIAVLIIGAALRMA